MRKILLNVAAFAAFTIWSLGFAAGQNQSVQNQPEQMTQGPVIEYLSGNSAVIAWQTTAPGSSIVRYGTDPNNLSQTAQAPWGQSPNRVNLNNLNPSTTYYFQVVTSQGEGTGTSTMSSISQFRTLDPGQQPQTFSKLH